MNNNTHNFKNYLMKMFRGGNDNPLLGVVGRAIGGVGQDVLCIFNCTSATVLILEF